MELERFIGHRFLCYCVGGLPAANVITVLEKDNFLLLKKPFDRRAQYKLLVLELK